MNLMGVAMPRLLEVYCGAGGSAVGFARAGWKVDGVDNVAQRNFPYKFFKADAVEFIKEHGHRYHAITGGPVCKRYSKTWRINNRDHPAQIPATREAMRATGLPYVIENVEDALPELINPMMLCGQDFGLRTYRHRYFESNVPMTRPCRHAPHVRPTVKMGRTIGPDDYYHAVGHFEGVELIRLDMGVEWMNRDEIAQCIPPAYTEHVGTLLRASLS